MTKSDIKRCTIYSIELAKEICRAVAQSTYGLQRLVNDNPQWPQKTTIFDWLIEHKEFAEIYALAKKYQVEALMDELLELADDTSKDIRETEKGFKFDHEHINRARLKVDTRKWIASKLVPRIYGDKLVTETVDNTIAANHAREIAHKCKTE